VCGVIWNMIPSFRIRADIPELMDDLELGGDTMRKTLDQLAIVNRFLDGGGGLPGLKKLLSEVGAQDRPILLADLGCGGGDGLRKMADWSRKAGLDMQFIGFDANPHVIAYAQEKSADYPEIRYEVANVCTPDFFAREVDIICCSLFLHHFSTSELEKMIPAYANMSRIGVVVSDLQRHPLPWVLFRLVSTLMGASHMIRYDGQVSIRRGFQKADLHALFQQTEKPYHLSWRWAFRYLGLIKSYQIR